MCVIKQLFYDKNIIFGREKNQYQKNLGKTCYMTRHSVIAKFRILKGLRGLKKSGIIVIIIIIIYLRKNSSYYTKNS